ncbi:ABC transporter substrate-binding protein [Motilimonas cestriensis]|uniref:ABC transporter substrate-binding protein n=1 Tax=Motilimonas cestriensis TaxID=2742685 RepID=A0ABS8WCS0_9GAMM|nr:ABC transporter substrate-binding protein [Motilimonas cestriensis]MCE2596070.1 ABC transporter substrate-binding protein [Motilimonas cestriensis]
MLLRFLLPLCLLLSTNMAIAASLKEYQDPYQLIEEVAGKAFARVKHEKALMEKDPAHAEDIVREELLFYVDSKYSAYKVVGPELRNTTPEQRENFVAAFKEHMVKTYSTVLFKYDQQVLQFDARESFAGKKIVTVPVRFVQAGSPDINVSFKLRLDKSTQSWRVFDVIAEGVSLLSTKQSELGSLIRKDGIDSVTAQLIAKSNENK